MSKFEQPKVGDPGNTKGPNYQTFRWVFTYNNYDSINDFENLLIRASKSYIFGEEIGESGTPHLQGLVVFKTKKRLETLKNEFGNKIHWEKCNNLKASIAYCQKDGKIHTNNDSWLPRKKIIDPMEGKKPYDWQIQVLSITLKEPDDRKINWFWCKKGCSGKTTLAKSLCIKFPNKVLYVSGKANDIKYAISQFVENHDPEIIIMDIPRDKQNYVSYGAIEEVKNGIFFCGKYESKQIIYNIPHVFVFANFPPDEDQLSKDRWNIIRIKL